MFARYKSLLVFISYLICSVVQAQDEWNRQPLFTAVSEKGTNVAIYSQLQPLEINRIHSWRLDLQTGDGTPLVNANVTVVGGMPEHDHGLPTQPRVTSEIEPGLYLLEGVRFHMPGQWEMDISFSYADSQSGRIISDSLLLNFRL